MAMPVGVAMYLAKMVWIALSGWVFTCLSIADEIAGCIRTGDIGAFHVGKATGMQGAEKANTASSPCML